MQFTLRHRCKSHACLEC